MYIHTMPLPIMSDPHLPHHSEVFPVPVIMVAGYIPSSTPFNFAWLVYKCIPNRGAFIALSVATFHLQPCNIMFDCRK